MTEMQVRNSERIALTTCPQKWWWAYEDRLKTLVPGPALRFGTLVHSALELYYQPGLKRGPHPRSTFERLYEETTAESYEMGFKDEDGTWHNMGELGAVLMDEYVDHYGEDNRWEVLSTEQAFRVPLTDPVSGLQFTFVGVIDLVMRDRASGKRKEVWLWDHKTCKDDPTKKAAALIMDEQSSSYWKYGVMWLREQGIIRPGTNLQGMWFNFLRKGMPDDRPRNKDGHYLNKPSKDVLVEAYTRKFKEAPPKGATVADLSHLIGPKRAAQLGEVSKTQPAPLFHREPVYRGEYDGEMVHKRTLAQARMMHYLRTGKLELTKTPGTLHSPHCNWCEFRNMCELHETGGDWETVKKYEFSVWEPYAQHEINNGEKV